MTLEPQKLLSLIQFSFPFFKKSMLPSEGARKWNHSSLVVFPC